jgi:hypothetical protein
LIQARKSSARRNRLAIFIYNSKGQPGNAAKSLFVVSTVCGEVRPEAVAPTGRNVKQAISNDASSGSSRMQPQYDAGPLYSPLLEALEADWPTAGDRERLIRALEARFDRWRRAKDVIDADWLKGSQQRVQEAGQEINADKLKVALEAEEEKRRAYFAADAEENQRYVAALGLAIKKSSDARNAAWQRAAEARLRRATNAINADINRRDRELLLRKRQ